MIKYIDGPIKNISNSQIANYVIKQNITHLYIDCKRNKKIGSISKNIIKLSHKNKYTITTYPNNIIFVTNTKNKETNSSTDNHNTNPHMENKKQTTT